VVTKNPARDAQRAWGETGTSQTPLSDGEMIDLLLPYARTLRGIVPGRTLLNRNGAAMLLG